MTEVVRESRQNKSHGIPLSFSFITYLFPYFFFFLVKNTYVLGSQVRNALFFFFSLCMSLLGISCLIDGRHCDPRAGSRACHSCLRGIVHERIKAGRQGEAKGERRKAKGSGGLFRADGRVASGGLPELGVVGELAWLFCTAAAAACAAFTAVLAAYRLASSWNLPMFFLYRIRLLPNQLDTCVSGAEQRGGGGGGEEG